MIDVHTHPVQVAELLRDDPALVRAVREVFGLFMPPQPLETFLLHLDEAGIDRAVLLPIDCTTAHGVTIVSNEQVAALVERCPRFIGFASVDPNLPDAPATLEHAAQEYGLRGVKLDPALQQFAIDDPQRAFPVYARAEELGLPLLIHCGMSWAPKGRSALANPLALEAVVQAFPRLRIIIAHLGWPWVNEAAMLAFRYPTVYLDTSVLFSGTPTESLRQALQTSIGIDALDRSLSRQIVFGSNYPRVDPKRAAWAVEALGLRPKLQQRIFHDNAAALLGLGGGEA
ncbi:MAG: amidohydrolase [Thermomicrobiales bacterium]|nr:amidohydrolase [Thermomicrobiales bacterium]